MQAIQFDKKPDKHVTVRRLKDGATLDIPLYTLADTLLQGFEVVEPTKEREIPAEVPKIECPLCGYVAKTERGLKVHKAKHV